MFNLPKFHVLVENLIHKTKRNVSQTTTVFLLSHFTTKARNFACQKIYTKMLQTQAMLRTGLASRAFFSTAAKEAPKAAAAVTATPSKPTKKKRLVVAVGGNALQRRGDRLTIENMLVCN